MAFLRGEILAALISLHGACRPTVLPGGPMQPGPRVPAFSAAQRDPQPGDDAAGQVRRILEDGGYQRSLPEDSPPERLDWDLGPFAALVRVLLWIGLAVVVGLAIAWLVSRLGGRPRAEEGEGGAGAPAPLFVPLESAERLAAAGRFAEAIHVLLLETLAALSRAAKLAPSLTSREIAARVPLPARARDALVGLVLAVEVSRFGGAPAGERDYRACLDRFHAFLETYRRGAQPAQGAPA